MHLPTQATGPPERAKPETATTEPLELEWSGEGESMDWPESGIPKRRNRFSRIFLGSIT